MVGSRAVRLYPLYHPAAALYTPSTLEALRTDFHRIPELLAAGAPPQPEPTEEVPEPEDLIASGNLTGPGEPTGPEELPGPDQPDSAERAAAQLGLF